MVDIYSFLEELSNNSDFKANLSPRGGYITFSNSGRRGGAKYFQIGLDNILQTLKDILANIGVFSSIQEYEETPWRDNGAKYFADPVANANSTVQTKPLFSTLSKIIIWANQPELNNIDPDKKICLEQDYLINAISLVEAVADKFKPSATTLKSNKNFPLQVIYFGAPGTGKSYAVEQITNNNNSIRTTFHPDSDYSTFVGCYKPMQKVGKQFSTKISLEKLKEKATEIINQPAGDKVEQIIDFISLYAERLCEIVEEREDVKSLQNLMNIHFGFSNETYLSKMILKVLEERKSNTNEITYAFQPQAFTQAYVKAWQNLNEPFYLVIEEINRGNCAQIFGDIFQLLDRDSDTGYSNYKITPDQDLQMYLANEFANTEIEDVEIKNGVKMQLPGNLHILATMNTSDQSLFPIDSAFKRRWDWKYIPIDYTDLGHYITCGDKKYKWIDFLTEVNKRIEAVTQSEDKKLGAWFVKAVNKEVSAEKFVSKVVFYLWNDIYKDLVHDASTVFKGNFDKFHKFFDFKGDVKLDVLDEFFESLEILYFTDDEESVSDKEDSDSKSHLIVQFPDGTKISENTRFETYQKALKIIGLEKAEQVASTMKYKRLNSPLISKTKSENILNNTQGYLYIEDGDFNIIKGINTRTMRRFLMQISDTYNLGINCVVE